MELNGKEIHPGLIKTLLQWIVDIVPDEAQALTALAKALPQLSKDQKAIILEMNVVAEREAFLAAYGKQPADQPLPY